MNNKNKQDGTIFYEKSRNRWRCKYKIFDQETSKFKMKSKMFLTEKKLEIFLLHFNVKKEILYIYKTMEFHLIF